MKLVHLFYSLLYVNINCDFIYQQFNHFWSNTGFCPPEPREEIPEYLLGCDSKINIALIGSLPNNGITHIRIHWLLNLLTSNGDEVYNFTYMDKFLRYLVDNRVYPIFEVMGSPNNRVSFKKEGLFWSGLIESIISRYIKMFGVQTMMLFKFETWNEPDLKGYNVMNFTPPEYTEYVNGCVEGLQRSMQKYRRNLKIGGPAGLLRDHGHPLCWGLLERSSREGILDYISFHRKGEGSADGVLNKTFTLVDEIIRKYATLKRKPFANDEADIERNWSKSLEWRGDVRYAAMIVKVIAGYYKSAMERKLRIEALSNDNAFLNYHPFYFTQRTLFARFQINTTCPPHSQFIKKPAYTVMALLAYLGDEFTDTLTTDPFLTVLSTRYKKDAMSFITIMVAYGNDSSLDGSTKMYHINVTNLWLGDWMYLVYRMDNYNTNPYGIWKELDSPVFPGKYERKKMRHVQEPQRLLGPEVFNQTESFNLNLNLTLPSIHLIHICSKPKKRPKRINSLRFINVTWNEVLITWKYNNKYSRCLLTFEVEAESKCSPAGSGYVRINPAETIFMSFHHAPTKENRTCENTRGKYRVRAIDYWRTAGKYSEEATYP